MLSTHLIIEFDNLCIGCQIPIGNRLPISVIETIPSNDGDQLQFNSRPEQICSSTQTLIAILLIMDQELLNNKIGMR